MDEGLQKLKVAIALLENVDDILIDICREALRFSSRSSGSEAYDVSCSEADLQLLEDSRAGYRNSSYAHQQMVDYLASFPNFERYWQSVARTVLSWRRKADLHPTEWHLRTKQLQDTGDKVWRAAVPASQSIGNAVAINNLAAKLRLVDDILDFLFPSIPELGARQSFANEYMDTLYALIEISKAEGSSADLTPQKIDQYKSALRTPRSALNVNSTDKSTQQSVSSAAVAEVGLSILHNPENAAIDIVFVHGLQGHPQATWTSPAASAVPTPTASPSAPNDERRRSAFRIFSKHKTAKKKESTSIDGESRHVSGQATLQDAGVYWPRDLLRVDLPTARIMTFGYNTRVTKGYKAANQGSIFSHARDLLYALDTKRRKTPDRRLVFIAHSLGGILVKEVLRRSEVDSDARLNKIFASTIGVFFFGTPHRGSDDWVSFGEGVAGVVSRILGIDKNDQVIHALLSTGPELELCRESFITQWVKRGGSLMVRTFQETKGITGVRWGGFNQLIVPAYSSTLDHPNQRARTVDSDHIGMVKFSGRDDITYEAVRDDLEELLDRPAHADAPCATQSS